MILASVCVRVCFGARVRSLIPYKAQTKHCNKQSEPFWPHTHPRSTISLMLLEVGHLLSKLSRNWSRNFRYRILLYFTQLYHPYLKCSTKREGGSKKPKKGPHGLWMAPCLGTTSIEWYDINDLVYTDYFLGKVFGGGLFFKALLPKTRLNLWRPPRRSFGTWSNHGTLVAVM